MTLSLATLVFLLVAIVLDHWLITGGLSFGARLAMWLALVAAGGAYFALRVSRRSCIGSIQSTPLRRSSRAARP